jgi:hypothetical protein
MPPYQYMDLPSGFLNPDGQIASTDKSALPVGGIG